MELDIDWYLKVVERLGSRRFSQTVVPVHIPDNNQQKYADYILNSFENSYDLVIVDGRNRCRCLANARSKVKVGGMLCLDNSERTEYEKAMSLLKDWEGRTWGDKNWMTTVCIRPAGEIEPIEFPNEDA
jgi:tRNA A58 N-methylase Trm61